MIVFLKNSNNTTLLMIGKSPIVGILTFIAADNLFATIFVPLFKYLVTSCFAQMNLFSSVPHAVTLVETLDEHQPL
jgi:hypothetical protein